MNDLIFNIEIEKYLLNYRQTDIKTKTITLNETNDKSQIVLFSNDKKISFKANTGTINSIKIKTVFPSTVSKLNF